MKNRVVLVSAMCIGMAVSAAAQHVLVCRGTDQVSIGSSAVFKMEEGQTYQIIGVSVNGNLMFSTPFGGADYRGDRFRVIDGGQYGGAVLILQNVKARAVEHWEENKAGWRTKYSNYTADWSGQVQLTGVQPAAQCYIAVQWYSDEQPVAAAAKIIGTLDPGRAVDVSFSLPITEAQRSGNFSCSVWSGEYELKPNERQKSDW